MRLLIDSHVLIWYLDPEMGLPDHIGAQLEDANGAVFVSAATAWEVTTKFRIGKLPQAAELARRFPEIVMGCGFQPLPITLEHGYVAGSLDGEHRDPFDRMLAAQARVERLPIVSRDPVFDALGVERIW